MISMQHWKRDGECTLYVMRERRWSWRKWSYVWRTVETGLMFMGMRFAGFARSDWKRRAWDKQACTTFRRVPLRHMSWNTERELRRRIRKVAA